MINKKNVLGKTPDELGIKDAIHTAIVSVRAGSPIKPGQRCGPNKDREFVPNGKGPGVADPFRKAPIGTGDAFWLILDQDAVPNVQHVWEHPTVDFAPPTKPVKRNAAIEDVAKLYGVTYEQAMAAVDYVLEHGESAPHPGGMTQEQIEELDFESYDFWSEWSDEVGHEFENQGSACCPEYEYPDGDLFEVKGE